MSTWPPRRLPVLPEPPDWTHTFEPERWRRSEDGSLSHPPLTRWHQAVNDWYRTHWPAEAIWNQLRREMGEDMERQLVVWRARHPEA